MLNEYFETMTKAASAPSVILSEAKNLVFREILRLLRSLRMTCERSFSEVSDFESSGKVLFHAFSKYALGRGRILHHLLSKL